jgi:hypothetical protein
MATWNYQTKLLEDAWLKSFVQIIIAFFHPSNPISHSINKFSSSFLYHVPFFPFFVVVDNIDVRV